MSNARSRKSNATPARQSRPPTVLPSYEAPSCPLNPTAIRALQNLPHTHSLHHLKAHLASANDTLANCAAEVNDRYYTKLETLKRKKARRAAHGADEDGNVERDEQVLEEMGEKVKGLTDAMEEGIRKVIDARAAVEATETALKEIRGNVAAGGGTAALTQSTLGASQFRKGRKRRRREDVDDDDEEEDEEEDEQDEEGDSQVGGSGPTVLLKRKLKQHEENYENLPLRTRYASHNDYISFKRLVHDSTHPGDDAPPLPNPSTWFPASPSAEKVPHQSQPGEEDSGSDLEVASERISVKCPLTLLPMQDPLSSTRCPHSFEKSAILDMISRSHMRVDGARDGERCIKCPVCEVVLTPATLKTNPLIVRKIKRLQALQNRAASSSPEPDDASDNKNKKKSKTIHPPQNKEGVDPKVKAEKAASSMTGRMPPQQERRRENEREKEPSVVPGTQYADEQSGVQEEEELGEGETSFETGRPSSSSAMIVDLGFDDDDDEEEEEEEDEV